MDNYYVSYTCYKADYVICLEPLSTHFVLQLSIRCRSSAIVDKLVRRRAENLAQRIILYNVALSFTSYWEDGKIPHDE